MILTQNEKLKQLNEHLKAKIAEHQPSNSSEADSVEERNSKLRHPEKRFRSRRELIDLTVLDRVHLHIRSDVEENMKNLRKLETRNEFNSIVSRIYEFLATSETAAQSNTPILTSAPPRIRVYKYEWFKDMPKIKT